jgi:hypothetical protein
VNVNLLERLFGHAQQLHALSVEGAPENEKEFVENRPPVIEISYEDGTEYEIRDLDTLRELVPGRGKRLESVKIYSRVGDFTCSIDLNTKTFYDPALIRAAGLEDKIGHFVDTVVSELSRDSDITVFARRIWAPGWAFFFSLLLWGLLEWREVHDFKTAYGLAVLILITTLVFSIPIEIFRNRWLPPVAFLWGDDGTRAKQAKVVVTTDLATVPLGIAINAISGLVVK